MPSRSSKKFLFSPPFPLNVYPFCCRFYCTGSSFLSYRFVLYSSIPHGATTLSNASIPAAALSKSP